MALHNSGSSSRDIGFDPPRSPGVRGKALHRLSSFPKLLGETSRALASPTRDGPLSPSMSPEPRSPGGRPVPPPKPSSSSKPAFARKSKSSSISLLSGRGQADRSQRIDAAENVGPPPMSAEQLAKTADTSYVRGWLDQSGNWVDSGDGVAQLEAAGVQIISRPSPPILPPRLPNASEPDFLKKYDRPPSANGSTGSTFLSTSSQRAAILSSWNATSSSQELHAPSRSHLARGRSSETVNSSGFSRPSTSPSIQSNSYESSLSGYPLMKDRDRASPSPNLTPRPAMSASPFLNPHTAGPAKGSVPSPGNSLGMASGGPFGLNTYLASANVSPRASTKPLFDPATGSARPTTSPGARARSNTSQHAGLLGAHLQSSPDTSTRLQPPPPPRHKAAVASGGRTHPFDSPVPPPPGGVAGALGQIGGIGAAVGKRGWEFMRGFNGPSSPNRPNAMENNSNWSFATVGRAGSPATVYSGAPAGANSVNEATRRWNAASSGPSTAGRVGGNGMLSVGWAAGAQEDAPAGVFGMPLREAVLRTRLVRQSQRRVEAEEKTLRARISDLDLGSEFHLPSSVLGGSSPSSSPTASPRSPPYRSIGPDKKAAGRSRAPIPRDKARTVYLPGVAVRCIESLEKYGFTEEGIYRLSGRSSHTAKLRAIFDAPAPPAPSLDVAPDLQLSDIEPADLDINAVCSLFKSYLRDLPSPLLSRELAPAFDAACRAATGTPATGAAAGIGLRPSAAPAASAQELTAMSGASAPAGSSGAGATRGETQLASEIAPLISRLPAPNFYLLRELADHLGDLATDEVVAHTKMVSLRFLACRHPLRSSVLY